MKIGSSVLILVEKITLVLDEERLKAIFSILAPENIRRPVMIGFVNAHAVNLCSRNSEFFKYLLEADYVFRDGSGMKILYRLLGRKPGLNLNGTDFIPRIISLYSGSETALLGTQEPYLGRAAWKVQTAGVKPVLLMEGFEEDHVYLERLKARPVSLIILAMGMPKQERVASLLARELDYPCLIVCGGAILDFLGGKVSRAPVLFRRLGMEWLYRLFKEPRRLFKRYVIGNFVFLFRSLVWAIKYKAQHFGKVNFF